MPDIYSINNVSYITPGGLVKDGIVKMNKKRIDSFGKSGEYDINPHEKPGPPVRIRIKQL